MKRLSTITLAVLGSFALSACNTALPSGTNSSTSDSNVLTLTGTLSDETNSSLSQFLTANQSFSADLDESILSDFSRSYGKKQDSQSLDNTEFSNAESNGNCLAAFVYAQNPDGQEISQPVDSNCQFEIDLPIDDSYTISFGDENERIGSISFDSGNLGESTEFFKVSSGGSFDLGDVRMQGGLGTCDNNPMSFNDFDFDGINDLEDSDDDGDGILDIMEADCDFDGALDDAEGALDCNGSLSEGFARILKVKPHENRRHHHHRFVDPDKKVKLVVACDVDESSVSETSFTISSEESDHTVACEYDLDIRNHHGQLITKVECEHDDDPFETDTRYQVLAEGMTCADGTKVEPIVFSFLTSDENLSIGDYEDLLEELLERLEELLDEDDDDVDSEDDVDETDDADSDSEESDADTDESDLDDTDTDEDDSEETTENDSEVTTE